MAGLFEGKESPTYSLEAGPDYSGGSVEDVTSPQNLMDTELQELVRNITLEDNSHDHKDDITHKLLDKSICPSSTDRGTMTEQSQQGLMVGPSQAAGIYREGPMQLVAGNIVRSHPVSTRVSSDSYFSEVQEAIPTQAQGGLGSVAGQSHVFLGTQSHANLSPFQEHSTSPWMSPLGPRLPSTFSWRGSLGLGAPSWGPSLGPELASTLSWRGPLGPGTPSWGPFLEPRMPNTPSWESSLGPRLPSTPSWRGPLGPGAPFCGPSLRVAQEPSAPFWGPSLGLRMPNIPSWGVPLGPSVPSRGPSLGPRLPSAPSLGVPQGPGLAKRDASIQNLSTTSRDSVELFLRDETSYQESPQGTEKKIQLYSEKKLFLKNGYMMNIFPSVESGLFKTGEHPYVCENFLAGTCERDSACPYYHTLLPFHWQFHHRVLDLWCSVPLGTQMHLEINHADPNRVIVAILYEHRTFYLNMNEKKFVKTLWCFDFARRLCCEDNSFFAPPINTFCLQGGRWIQHSQENPNWVTLYKNGMKSPNLQESFKIVHRPKYIPLYQNVNNLRVWYSDSSRNLGWWGEEPSDVYIGRYPCLQQVALTALNDNFSVMEVVPSEPAYQHCCQLFHASVPPERAFVLRIYRYYNPFFWELYQREKRQLKNLQIPSPLEYQLFFQGYINLKSLAKKGLCPRLGSAEGSLGRGLYFSLNPYITPSTKNPQSGYMTVLAKVLVGEKTLGHPLLLAPPLKEDGQEYDSCVDDMEMPTLFNVFRKELTYPYFIIFYKRLEDPIHLVP